MTATPAVDRARRASPADTPALIHALEHGLAGQEGRDLALANQFLLDALDRGEAQRFLVWPGDDPVAVCYLGETGTVLPAGHPDGGGPLAEAAESSSWRVLIGDAALGQRMVDRSGRGLFRRKARAREQRFLIAEGRSILPHPSGLRRARSDDLEVLTAFACLLHVEDQMGPPISRAGRASVRARMRDSVLAGATWVVEADGRPVAKVDAALRSPRRGAQIAGVYVDPDWRGRGIGAASVAAVADTLRDEGAPGVTLHVRADNAPGLRAYARAGFVDAASWILALR